MHLKTKKFSNVLKRLVKQNMGKAILLIRQRFLKKLSKLIQNDMGMNTVFNRQKLLRKSENLYTRMVLYLLPSQKKQCAKCYTIFMVQKIVKIILHMIDLVWIVWWKLRIFKLILSMMDIIGIKIEKNTIEEEIIFYLIEDFVLFALKATQKMNCQLLSKFRKRLIIWSRIITILLIQI